MRKALLGAGISMALLSGLMAMLVLGTYAAAIAMRGGAGGGPSSTGLAKDSVPAKYRDLVRKAGQKCSAISPALLAAQLYQESGWRANARSAAEAQGIAQFIPGTWATHGVDGDGDGDKDVWDPADAIPSAAAYDCKLAEYVEDVPGDQTKNMLAAYNAGAYRVIQYDGVPPYRETRNYVDVITKLEKSFAAHEGRLDPSKQAAEAIGYAQEKLGTPYLWGGDGTAEDKGRFDCSGLSKAAYDSVGIELPRVAHRQWNTGPHPKRDELLPGDLVFFAHDLDDPNSIHHVGIYVGGGYMIDAPYTGSKIRFDPIDSPDYFGATRPTAG